MSMSTNSVASAAELEVIKQWLKKIAGLGEVTEVEPCLPQSKSFLKILGVLLWNAWDMNNFYFLFLLFSFG